MTTTPVVVVVFVWQTTMHSLLLSAGKTSMLISVFVSQGLLTIVFLPFLYRIVPFKRPLPIIRPSPNLLEMFAIRPSIYEYRI